MCSARNGSTSGRQQVSRTPAGAAAGDAAAKSPVIAAPSQPALNTQPAAQSAGQPQGKLDEKLFTLGMLFTQCVSGQKTIMVVTCHPVCTLLLLGYVTF